LKKVLILAGILCMLAMVSFVSASTVADMPSSAVAISSVTMETSAFATAKTSGLTANGENQVIYVQKNDVQAWSTSTLTSRTIGNTLANTANTAANLTNGNSSATADQGNNLTINTGNNYSGEKAQSATTVLKYLIPVNGIDKGGITSATAYVLKIVISSGLNTGYNFPGEYGETASKIDNLVTTFKIPSDTVTGNTPAAMITTAPTAQTAMAMTSATTGNHQINPADMTIDLSTNTEGRADANEFVGNFSSTVNMGFDGIDPSGSGFAIAI